MQVLNGAKESPRFLKVRIIDRGTFSDVYLGIDRKTNEDVAIKVDKTKNAKMLETERKLYETIPANVGLVSVKWFGDSEGETIMARAIKYSQILSKYR